MNENFITKGVIDPVEGLSSVTVALLVTSGSRDESRSARGTAHILEHLITTTQTDKGNLVELCDSLGGSAEAITTPEFTLYAATLPSDYFADGWHLLKNQFLNPDLRLSRLNAERSVVLDEIASSQSNSSRYIHELALTTILGNHPLGYPVKGKPQDIIKLTVEDVEVEYRRQLKSRVIPIVSGGVEYTSAEKAFDCFQPVSISENHLNGLNGGPVHRLTLKDVQEEVSATRSHVLVSWVLLNRTPEDDFILSVINRILGGTTKGELQKAFAGKEGEYSCYTYRSIFTDCAVISAYASCNSNSIDETVQRIIETVEAAWFGALCNPLTVKHAEQSLKGSLAIGLETTRMRVNWIGRMMLNQVTPAKVTTNQSFSPTKIEDIHSIYKRIKGPQVTVLKGVS